MRTLMAIGILLLAGCTGFDWPEPSSPRDAVAFRGDVSLHEWAADVDRPVQALPGPDGSTLVVEQTGRVWQYADGNRALWLDVTDVVGDCHPEQGLLGLAIADDGRRYVSYTDADCDSVRLSRLGAEEELLIREGKRYPNHNGGGLAFGPDGMLYWSLGDGGSAGDPHDRAQDPDDRFGSILRLNVTGASGYEPAGAEIGAPEVWIYGLRNPWRFAFDPDTDDLWIADVGQDKVEEVNHLRPDQQRGANLGWPLFEGTQRFRQGAQASTGLTAPAVQYTHAETGGCSVTGGVVLRRSVNPTIPDDLEGAFLFADFCSGDLWGVRPDGYRVTKIMDTGLQVTGFGMTGEGDILLMHWGGSVHELRF